MSRKCKAVPRVPLEAEKGRSLALKENSFQNLKTWGNSICEESFGSWGAG